MAASLVGHHRGSIVATILSGDTSVLAATAGRSFVKMSGSGNDFIMIDATSEPARGLLNPEVVRAICTRRIGVGADGLVMLEPSEIADFKILYLNSDGSHASLCGNASLCSARLALNLGIIGQREFRMETDAGVLAGRFVDGGPEIDLPSVHDVLREMPFRQGPGESWIGFADSGVPHLVIRMDEVVGVDVARRGRPLRYDPSLAEGANVNFVAPDGDGGWRMRTYERGVEGETLACGTGAVATAILLAEHGDVQGTVGLLTQSGRTLQVRLERQGDAWFPSLSGEARVIYEARFPER